jgi:cysteine dioxygenase
MTELNQLIENINKTLTKDTKLNHLTDLFNGYTGTDWKQHIKFNPDKYMRIYLHKNDYYEVILICWSPNQSSGIHDHPTRGCLLKLLQGKLTEVLYNKDLTIKSSAIISPGDISYQEGAVGIHNIINMDTESVSLHIYAPPCYKPNYFCLK